MENELKSKKETLMDFVKVILWTLHFGYKVAGKFYIFYNITSIIETIIPIIQTYLTAQLINNIIVSLSNSANLVDNTNLLVIIAAIFSSTIIEKINSICKDYTSIRFNYIWDVSVWPIFLQKSVNLDFQYIESADYNILMHKAKEAIEWRSRELAKSSGLFISNIIGIFLILGILLSLNPIFIILLAIPLILQFLINRKFGNDIYSFWDSHGETKIHTWHAQHTFEKDDVLREAKIYDFSQAIFNRFKEAQYTFIKNSIKKLNRKSLSSIFVLILDNLIFIAIQVWLIIRILSKEIPIGDFTFYIASLSTITQRFSSFLYTLSWMYEQTPYLEELKKYLELPDIIEKPKNGVKFNLEYPKIEFKNVSFAYPNTDKMILKNVSFKIEKGEKVALVGENGAGKTTIIKLLARFYDVTEGEVLINDINIRELDLKSYYKLWGVLFQSFAKLWFSVRENIGIGNIEDIEKIDLVREAAKKADADEFTSKLPRQYETLLSKDFKDGASLSGGEWQKIGIARALFANPKFIVMDEPTSALDALAEAKIFDQLRELSENSTMIIVSHRFATVRNADKILVLENGEIEEQGSHEELIKHNGLYYKMFTTQAEGYK